MRGHQLDQTMFSTDDFDCGRGQSPYVISFLGPDTNYVSGQVNIYYGLHAIPEISKSVGPSSLKSIHDFVQFCAGDQQLACSQYARRAALKPLAQRVLGK